jgi:hypothetical protein
MGLGAYVDQGLNRPLYEQRDELIQRAIAMADGIEGCSASLDRLTVRHERLHEAAVSKGR